MRPVEPKDYAEVMRWWTTRTGSPSLPAELFPDSGFIVDGKAAVFLFKTNSAIAYLDLLISNPEVPLSESQAALDCVIKGCIEEARKCGFKLLRAETSRPYVTGRALKLGFDADPGYWHLSMRL